MRRTVTSLIAVYLLAPCAVLSAQEPQPVEPGARVRLWQECTQVRGSRTVRTICPTTAVFSAIAADSIVLAPVDGVWHWGVSLASVTKLEASRGRRTTTGGVVGGALGGLILGAGVGAGVGAGIGAVTEPVGGGLAGSGMVFGAAIGAAIGGVAGLVGGIVAGALIQTERWEEIPLDRLRVSFAPHGDGFAFGIWIAF